MDIAKAKTLADSQQGEVKQALEFLLRLTSSQDLIINGISQHDVNSNAGLYLVEILTSYVTESLSYNDTVLLAIDYETETQHCYLSRAEIELDIATEMQDAFPDDVPSLYYPIAVPEDVKSLVDDATANEESINGLGSMHLTGSRICAFKSRPNDPKYNPTLIILAPKA